MRDYKGSRSFELRQRKPFPWKTLFAVALLAAGGYGAYWFIGEDGADDLALSGGDPAAIPLAIPGQPEPEPDAQQ